jgi:hypothetical protein
MNGEITTAGSAPKGRTMQVPAKLVRKVPQILKEQFPSSTTISLKSAHVSASHPIVRTPAGMQSRERPAPEKQASEMSVTPLGMWKNRKEEHPSKPPSDESFESPSNATFKSLWHPEKEPSQRRAREEGIQMNRKDVQFAKAVFPICESRDPSSKPMNERFLQDRKDSARISSIEAGI